MHAGFGEGNDDEVDTHVGDASEHEEDEGSASGGSVSKCSYPDDSGSEDESDGEVANPEGSDSNGKESGSENKESRSRSGSGSSASESEEETPKVKQDGVPSEAPLESDPNASQTPLIPEVNNKDSKDEWRSNCHNFTQA